MDNININELKELSRSIGKPQKPKLAGIKSLNDAARSVHFGAPNIAISNIKPETKIASSQYSPQKIKIKISSPTIKTKISKPDFEEKKLVQETDIERLFAHGEFSSESISFIPYGAGFINAKEALNLIKIDYQQFKTIEENYLTPENIQLIITKIDKIFDLEVFQKDALKDFYSSILYRFTLVANKRKKAQTILEKIKSKEFRLKLSGEVQRMAKNGDLWKYYNNFSSIDEIIKKKFLVRIASIDSYILKKIKELIILTQNDVNFRFDEILEFHSVIESRNILMTNFHDQIEHLTRQKNQADKMLLDSKDLLGELIKITAVYSKNGKFGRSIARSEGLLNRLKNNYFEEIAVQIEPAMIDLERIVIDLETGNYEYLEAMKQRLDNIDLKNLEDRCNKIYEKIIKQAIQ